MSVVTKLSFGKETIEKRQSTVFTSGGRERWMGNLLETLIMVGILSVAGFVNEKTKPQEYYYENGIVTVYKKYQCPNYCQVDHFHYVYFDSLLVGHDRMCIDKEKLGEKYKEPDKKDV